MEAGTAASDAIGRIPEVQLPDDDYLTRKLDAEKAIDAASHKVTTDSDNEIFKVLVAWNAFAVRQYEAHSKRDMKAFERAAEASLYCATEAEMVFNPRVLSEKGRQKAAEKKCLAEYQKMRDAGR